MRPDKTAIEVLERWLAEAKAGTLITVAIAGVRADGTVTSTISTGGEVMRLLGGVSHLHHRMNGETALLAEPDEVPQLDLTGMLKGEGASPPPPSPAEKMEADAAYRLRLFSYIDANGIDLSPLTHRALHTGTGATLDALGERYDVPRLPAGSTGIDFYADMRQRHAWRSHVTKGTE